MSSKHNFKPLAVAVGAALATSLGAAANADSSPFAMTSLASGYMSADAGEGKCGEGKCGGGKMMDNMDSDGDGNVSRDEHAAHWDSQFDEADANGDDEISASEMESAHEAKGMEGSCGGKKGEEGSCGGDKGEEGKCGEGKCGGSV